MIYIDIFRRGCAEASNTSRMSAASDLCVNRKCCVNEVLQICPRCNGSICENISVRCISDHYFSVRRTTLLKIPHGEGTQKRMGRKNSAAARANVTWPRQMTGCGLRPQLTARDSAARYARPRRGTRDGWRGSGGVKAGDYQATVTGCAYSRALPCFTPNNPSIDRHAIIEIIPD